MTAIVDYRAGNLTSVQLAFAAIGEAATVTDDPEVIVAADRVVFPGVGAAKSAMESLKRAGLVDAVRSAALSGRPFLGICLGMQLLFEKSSEYGEHEGLGLLKGNIVGMEGRLPAELKIPHIGWNQLHFVKDSYLLSGIRENDCVYFVHSFYAEDCEDSLVATAEYGKELTAMVQKDNVMGCQFHPEKSGSVGLAILKAFCEGKK